MSTRFQGVNEVHMNAQMSDIQLGGGGGGLGGLKGEI